MLTTNLTVIDLFVLAGIGEERDACGSPFRRLAIFQAWINHSAELHEHSVGSAAPSVDGIEVILRLGDVHV